MFEPDGKPDNARSQAYRGDLFISVPSVGHGEGELDYR